MKKVLKFIYFYLLYRLFFIFPIKNNRIIFSSWLGKFYNCNPEAICNYILNKKLNYELIYVLNKNDSKLPEKIKKVKRGSIKYLFYLSTAKYWIFNTEESSYLKPKKGVIYLQTWHGTALKKIAQDIENEKLLKLKGEWKKSASYWHYLIVPNKNLNQLSINAFGLKKCKIINCNYPRNEKLKLINNKSVLIDKLKDYKIDKSKKNILYLPTFRDDEEIFSFVLSDDFIRKITENYNFLLRLHPKLKNKINNNKIIDVSNYDDINDLYLITDILITDYSSVFFDFALLEKPMIFYPYDLEKYKNKLRGFYYDYKKVVPGIIVLNEKELLSSIEKIDSIFNRKKLKEFNNYFNNDLRIDSIEKILKNIGIENKESR